MNRTDRQKRAPSRSATDRSTPGLRAALAAFDAGNMDDSAARAEAILACAPDNVAALLLAGMSNIVLGRPDRAIAHLEALTAVAPSRADGYLNLGAAYQSAQRVDEAVAAYRRALALDPTCTDAHANLAIVLRDAGDAAGAETEFRAALAQSPGDARLNKSLGALLSGQGRMAEAGDCLTRAVALAPDNAEFRMDRGIHRLSQGEFRAGWRDLEARWREGKSGSHWRAFPQRTWHGEALAGKSIVVWSEQGIGDQILHGSQLRSLAARCARVVMDVDPRLVALFQRSLTGIGVVPMSDPPVAAAADPAIDFQVPLASLALHTPDWPIGLFPASRWLVPDPERAAALAARLARAARGRPTIGLSWRSQRAREGVPKSSSLADWMPILRDGGRARDALFVTLQYGDTDREVDDARAVTGADIYTDPEVDRFNDLDGLAALIDSLDVVVTTSNVTAHFAGALGKPTLLALHHVPIWYWFPAFDAYASIKRFRQTKAGDWRPVMADMSRRLTEILA